MIPSSDQNQAAWHLVFLRYGNALVTWDSGGWLLMDIVFLVQAASRSAAIHRALACCEPLQPTPEGVASPFVAGSKDLQVLGAAEVLPIGNDWSHGASLSGRDFSYEHWDDFLSSIMRPDQLVDVEPFGASEVESTPLRDIELVPPRTQAEFATQKTRPAWYLVEVSYGRPGVHWMEGGVAVVHKWHAVHADRDSAAFHRALEAAAPAVDVSRAAVDAEGHACKSLERVGVSGLIPTWDPWCDGSELGYNTFEYDASISWADVLDELEWIDGAKPGHL